MWKLWFFTLLWMTASNAMALRADLNGDCRVDFLDLAILASEWMQEDEDCMSNRYATFDGSTGYVAVPNAAALNFGTGDFSISFWTEHLNTNFSQIMGKHSYAAPGWLVYYSADEGWKLYLNADASPTTVLAGGVADGTWKHVAFTVDRYGVGYGYVNGIRSPFTVMLTSGDLDVVNDFNIGANPGVNFFAGSLDDLRIYKKALSEAEVAAIYNNGNGKKYSADDAGAAAFVMEFDHDFVADEIFSTTTPQLTGTRTGDVTISDGGVPLDHYPTVISAPSGTGVLPAIRRNL